MPTPKGVSKSYVKAYSHWSVGAALNDRNSNQGPILSPKKNNPGQIAEGQNWLKSCWRKFNHRANRQRIKAGRIVLIQPNASLCTFSLHIILTKIAVVEGRAQIVIQGDGGPIAKYDIPIFCTTGEQHKCQQQKQACLNDALKHRFFQSHDLRSKGEEIALNATVYA